MKTIASLENKHIVITGASMGIGQAVAIRLAEAGAKLIINARGETGLKETIDAINKTPGEAISCCGSVSDYAFCEQLVQTCIDQYGSIDGLINCAGIAEPYGSSILDIDPSDWHQLIDIHLHGTFNTCRIAAPILAKQKSGVIINTSSHAFLGMYGGTGYASGKGATNSLSLAMAMDLREHNVSVNVICPGAKTRLSSGDDYEALINKLNQRGLLADDLMENSLAPPPPSYVASLYAYLCTEEARHISGRIFWAAGGYLGQFHRNTDQLIDFTDHQYNTPRTLEELDQLFRKNKISNTDELFNSLVDKPGFRVAVKQSLLVKIGNQPFIKKLMDKQQQKKAARRQG